MQLARSLALVGLALAGSCRTTAHRTEIGFERVHADRLCGILEAKNAVARSFAEWQAFWPSEDMWTFALDVDWSKHMLIAVALGSRPSAGYSVEIDRVYQQGSHWEVHARETRPGPDLLQAAVVTTPYDCVLAPRFEGRVVFNVE